MKAMQVISGAAVLLLLGVALFYVNSRNEPLEAIGSKPKSLTPVNGDGRSGVQIATSQSQKADVVDWAMSNGGYQDPRAVTSRENQTPPAGRAIDVIRRLTPQAEQGDARAALQIFQKLEQCQDAMKTDVRAGGLADQASHAGDRSYALKQIEAVLKDCQGIEEQDFASMAYWLENAADGGNLLAMLRYSSAGSRIVVGDATEMLRNPERVIEYKKKALGYLHQASAKGVPEAMLSLANTYKHGVMTKEDPVQAYAYALAAQMVHPSGPPGGQAQFLSIYSDGLSPENLAKGKVLARDVYDKCCVK
ncbi:hypothetical protein SAMN04487939_12265 [Lysobacter sp. yr284]|uniref:sel1 repeat family protein n=1 Tax=Lysobacter sp. yr284 TaxID=1761791 RepID=UPI0008995A5E|nr:sel1 repeat family protein [Lysobacter sp. yr284]SDZ20524.1 hypothetical protein SAMN04487939_12265 [Lysobacter sp. yr284]